LLWREGQTGENLRPSKKKIALSEIGGIGQKIALYSLDCMPCIKGLVASLLPRRVSFDPRPLRVRYMMDKVSRGEVSVWVSVSPSQRHLITVSQLLIVAQLPASLCNPRNRRRTYSKHWNKVTFRAFYLCRVNWIWIALNVLQKCVLCDLLHVITDYVNVLKISNVVAKLMNTYSTP